MYLWCLCTRLGVAARLKIALKAPLRTWPLFGWATQAFLFLFLSRENRQADLERVSNTLAHFVGWGDDAWLLIFPEGTDLSPANVKKSNEHADARGVPRHKHTLHVRTAGFTAAVKALGASLDAVYDLTVRYDNHPAVQASADPRPSEKAMVVGACPRTVHFHAERFARADLPSGSESELAQWLVQRWALKEAHLAAAADAKPGGLSAAAAAAPPSALDAAPLVKFCGTILGWSALLVLTTINGLRSFGTYTLIGCAIWWGLGKHAGGLDGLERSLLQPPLPRGAAATAATASSAR